MGSSSSKAARTTANIAARKYPQRAGAPPPPPPRTSNQPANPSQRDGSAPSYGPTVHPATKASETRDQEVNLDASDPDFAASLRQLGAVQPSPTLSHSSTFNQRNPGPNSHTSSDPSSAPSASQHLPDPAANPALRTLHARDRLSNEADQEFSEAGRGGHAGRQHLDVVMIRQLLMLRDEKGLEEGEIERRLGLKKGVVARLGARHGVVAGV